MQSILVIYILYYLIYKYFPKKRVVYIGIALIIYSFISFWITDGFLYFQSVFAFESGILWAIYKEKIDRSLKREKYYFLFLILAFFIFSLTLLIGNLNLSNVVLINIISKTMSSVFFVVLVLLIVMKIELKNKLTSYLGKIFFEIYIIQWVGIRLWHSQKLYIKNDLIYLCVSVLTTIVLAIIIHPMINFINKKIKELLNLYF